MPTPSREEVTQLVNSAIADVHCGKMPHCLCLTCQALKAMNPFLESDAATIAALKKQAAEQAAEIERLLGLVRNGFDVQRVVAWQHTPNRQMPSLAFTAGGERAAADLIEAEQKLCGAEIERLRGEAKDLHAVIAERDARIVLETRLREAEANWSFWQNQATATISSDKMNELLREANKQTTANAGPAAAAGDGEASHSFNSPAESPSGDTAAGPIEMVSIYESKPIPVPPVNPLPATGTHVRGAVGPIDPAPPASAGEPLTTKNFGEVIEHEIASDPTLAAAVEQERRNGEIVSEAYRFVMEDIGNAIEAVVNSGREDISGEFALQLLRDEIALRLQQLAAAGKEGV